MMLLNPIPLLYQHNWKTTDGGRLLGCWMLLVATVALTSDPALSSDEATSQLVTCFDVVLRLQEAEQESGYRVAKLLEFARVHPQAPATPP